VPHAGLDRTVSADAPPTDSASATDPTAPVAGFEAPALLLGAYSPDYLGTADGVQRQLSAMDAEAGQRVTFGGVFVGLEDPNPAYDIPAVFSALTEAGYTPFMNLAAGRDLAAMADGEYDDELRAIAEATATWAAQTDDPLVFVAPLPEMNGDWEAYGEEPEAFKRFFARLQGVYAGAGVPGDTIRWVFAPNGWSREGHEFEGYYPGDELVDVIGFSAYQWGGCGDGGWQTPEEVYGPYLERIAAMSPDKPIVVTQTAATSVGEDGAPNEAAKDDFLEASYHLLADTPQVLGVMYFNLDKECDWSVYRDGVISRGYRAGANALGVDYLSPAELSAVR